METLKKFIRSQVGTAALFAAAAALILVGTVGGARAATPPYTARDYVAEIGIPEVGDIAITKNKVDVGDELLADVNEIKPGVLYKEPLAVTNTSPSDAYVRVTLHKSWKKGGENADTTLAPSLIELGLAEGNGWVVDEDATTAERVVLYYTGVVAANGGETPAFLESVKVSDRLPALCKQDVDGNVITTTFDYDNATLSLVATVDAVQTHNAEDAILYSWGRDVSVSGGTLSLD